ncbi:lysylphosphatidylglycerol synthase domain-containing protein [Mariniblastus fucicola]|uniref:Lysylphosphatidylglycerol synthase TM region n=1 Tax=Mariniblastus fucicola TaxID=980251 RepID=A0A5B9P9P8_9BACT|nr:lysylphosphatidylglycerol synthase domain-containing protein [Mariniblastus fucicola]QEG23024.1 hypothetical protein MFFC18_29160 [Mariniblastus fucicola]
MNSPIVIESAETPKRRSRLVSVAKSAVTAAVIVTIAVAAWKLNQQLDIATSFLSVGFALGTVLAIAYRAANPYGWALVLQGMGYNVNATNATRIWLVAESRRWLPGGIWGYASRAVASKELGLTKTVASASMAVELLVTIAAAVVVSLAGLLIHQQQLMATASELFAKTGMDLNLVWLTVVAITTASVATYLLRHKLTKKLAGLTEKFSAVRGLDLNFAIFAKALGYFVVMAAMNGLVNSALLQAIDAPSVPLVALIAATATAWIIGFFAFFSPGGILVREAALAALLLPWLPYEAGFSLAILSRFAQMIAEVVCMLLALRKPKS